MLEQSVIKTIIWKL